MKSAIEGRYSFPLLLAISLHVLVLAFLIFQLSLPVRSSLSSAASTNIVQAVAISQQALDQYQKVIQQQAIVKQQEQQAQQLAVQKAQQLAAQEAQQRAAQITAAKAAQQAALLAKQQAVLKAQQMQQLKQAQQLQQQQAAAKLAQLAKQAAVKAQQAQAKQQQQAQQLKQQLMQQMQSDLATDQKELDQNAKATQAQTGEIDKYKALVIQAISQQWIIPQNLPNNLACELDIRIAPGGAVIQVMIAKSSGNTVLDNSAVAAVNKASPLPVPTDAALFDQFRELHLTVKPDGPMMSD
jgi:colicin import membrane protein